MGKILLAACCVLAALGFLLSQRRSALGLAGAAFTVAALLLSFALAVDAQVICAGLLGLLACLLLPKGGTGQ